MRVRHKDARLERVERDRAYNAEGAYSETVIRGFRKALNYLRNAADERDIRQHKSLHYHKLSGQREHQYAIDVSDQFRLILEWEGEEASRTAVVIGIEDYH